jgi:hypothetical protein
VSRRGVPAGRSITYSRSSAVKAIRDPSGDGTASRICFTVNAAESLTGYSNRTSGPTATSAETVNGIFAAGPPSTGTLQISPQ